MKKILSILICLLLLGLSACAAAAPQADIAATTLPVYEFTLRLCQGTGLQVTRLVTENVSCLHDYSLNVKQVKAAEAAELIVLNGAGLEDFMGSLLTGKKTVDASTSIPLLESCHHHDHTEDEHNSHEHDAHIWLSPANAMLMARNICDGLITNYPQHAATFQSNFLSLIDDIQALENYAAASRPLWEDANIITFHDGFQYLANWCGIEIIRAIEEESGAEASAKELIEIVELVRQHQIQAIFTETNGSTSAASVISAETGVKVYSLSMAMSGESWFEAMYHNIDTLKEALG